MKVMKIIIYEKKLGKKLNKAPKFNHDSKEEHDLEYSWNKNDHESLWLYKNEKYFDFLYEKF